METPIKMDDLGVPLFLETSIYCQLGDYMLPIPPIKRPGNSTDPRDFFGYGIGTKFLFLLFDWNPNLDECFFIAFRDSPGPREVQPFQQPM